MVRLFVPLAPLSLDCSPVCQTDNSCANFPIRGDIASLDATDSVNMTCYKGGETVFNNHQFCDVTSRNISLHLYPLVLLTRGTQIVKSSICYPAVLLRSLLAVTSKMRHATSSFGPPRSSHSTARSIRVRQRLYQDTIATSHHTNAKR
jgi:hypothetical protein